jgi:hypothetical protein
MGLGFCDEFCSTKLGGRKALKINCPNCAAPIEPELNKCPYCGTTYFDMSCIDFENEKPFYLKIKTKYKGFNCYITQFVKPKLTTIEQSYSTNDITGGRGNLTILRETFEEGLTTNISFSGIPFGNNELMRVEIGNESN